jgi:hypothetical protein
MELPENILKLKQTGTTEKKKKEKKKQNPQHTDDFRELLMFYLCSEQCVFVFFASFPFGFFVFTFRHRWHL